MFQLRRSWFLLVVLTASLASCSNKGATTSKPLPATGSAQSMTSTMPDSTSTTNFEASLEEKYQSALLESLSYLFDQKYSEALVSLQAAQAIKDNIEVRQQMAKVQAVLLNQKAFNDIVIDIQTVIDQGDGAQASQLAVMALVQFGGRPEATKLAALKFQADALVASANPDAGRQVASLRSEADTALKENNLRNAVICYEQALALKQDIAVQKQLEALHARLNSYETAMERAATLRRNPQTLDDSVLAYQDALKAWDTLQARDELADVQLALEMRRDRLAVANFEVQGDASLAGYGSAFADELLPHFKRRFDLVERGQVDRVLEEFKMDSDDLLFSQQGRTDLGKLAKTRYLVVGNIIPLSGMTVYARMIDLKTGLVVQTAKVVALSAEEVARQLPQLATQLMMSDEEKLSYDKRYSQLSVPAVINTSAALPPVPVVNSQSMPETINYSTARPPAYGTLQADEYDRLPALSSGSGSLSVYAAEQERPLRLRLLGLQFELGDNHFRRGRYREALRCFQLARELDPLNMDILTRINQCVAYLPPLSMQPIVQPIRRDRMALLHFFVESDPRKVSPELSTWIPENLMPYFGAGYEVIDRDEVNWIMSRLGLTLGDVVRESGVRRWLGRALGVRYLVVGRVQSSGGISVTTVMLDAEHGWEVGRAQIVVHHLRELKLRLPELARMTLVGAAERARLVQEAVQWEGEYLQAWEAFQRKQFGLALEIAGQLRLRQPMNVRIGFLFTQCEKQNRLMAMQEARMNEMERQRHLMEQASCRQVEMILAAERARQNASRSNSDRQRQRDAAHNQLLSQARLAVQNSKFSIAIQLFDGVLAFRPQDDAILRESAQARVLMEDGRRKTYQMEALHREESQRRRHEMALTAARQQWMNDRESYSKKVLAFQAHQRQQDAIEYSRLVEQAKRLKAEGRFDQAASLLEVAKRVLHTEEVDRLLNDTLVNQARAQAKGEDAARFAELEKKLAQEAARRSQNELDAQRNWALYQTALKQGQDAKRVKNLQLALAKYQEASRIFSTQEVITGLQSVQVEHAQEQRRLAILKKEADDKAHQSTEVAKWLAAGKIAEKARKYDEALDNMNKAKALDPANVEILGAVVRLDQARSKALEEQKSAAARDISSQIKRLITQAEARAKAKQFDGALSILVAAQKIAPNDKQIFEMISIVKDQQSTERQAILAIEGKEKEARRKETLRIEREEKAKQLAGATKKQVETALTAGDLRAAEAALTSALKLAPNDPGLMKLQQELTKAQSQVSRTAAQTDAKARLEADAQVRTAKQTQQQHGRIGELLKQAQAATMKKDYSSAEKLINEALTLDSTNLAVGRAQRELQTARQTESQSKAAMSAVDRKKQEEELAKKKVEFTRLMKEGKEALASEEYEKATKLFSDAKALNPEDADAALFLGMAKRDSERAKAEAEVARKDAEASKKREMEAAKAEEDLKKKTEEELRRKLTMDADAKKRAEALKALNKQEYDDAFKAGKQALSLKKYDEAIVAFGKALQLVPGDKEATALLTQAKKLKADSAMVSKQEVMPQNMSAAQLLAQAAALQKQQKWEAALAVYRQVLAKSPNDQTAKAGATQCEFQVNFEAGRAALDKKSKEVAIKAFETALKLAPGHQEAQKLLKQARDLK